MRKIILLAALCLAAMTGAALAAEKCSTLQIPVKQRCCAKQNCVNCSYTDNCGTCHDVAYEVEGCGSIPVAQEECRTIDPGCAPGSQFCLLDASRGQYTMCCIGACFNLLSKTQKDLCPKCKQDCGCKQKCGCAKDKCGCKKQDCGCKSKCGCESKCKSCTGECRCYQPYTGYTPIPPPAPVRGPQETYVYYPTPDPPAIQPVPEEEKPVIKVEGRG